MIEILKPPLGEYENKAFECAGYQSSEVPVLLKESFPESLASEIFHFAFVFCF